MLYVYKTDKMSSYMLTNTIGTDLVQ
jgi:hypothetical protein